MWERRVDQEVGRRVHWLIGHAIAYGLGPSALPRLVAELFAANPLQVTAAASVRSRCVSRATVYLTRCAPVGWTLVGIEEELEHCRVDLLFANDSNGSLVSEELKAGRPTMMSSAVAEQVGRQFAACSKRWKGAYVGHRVVTLGAPDRSWMLAPRDGEMRRVSPLAGLEIR